MFQFDFSSLIYPAPMPQYDTKTFKNMEFVPVPNKRSHKYRTRFVPFLFMEGKQTNIYMLYFHGNAEDIFNASKFIEDFQQYISVNVIIVEYPGYGIYQGFECSSEQMEEDALFVYEFVKLKYKCNDSQMFVFGRSIGSGPACFLGTQKDFKCLITMSAYQSIQQVARDHVKFFSFLVKDRFNNVDRAKSIRMPMLLLHGSNDTLIGPSHSDCIFRNLKPDVRRLSRLKLSTMTHNDYQMEEDITTPVHEFCNSLM